MRRRSGRISLRRLGDVLAVEAIVPPVGSCSRVTSRARVDLPQPDSPTMPTVSPRARRQGRRRSRRAPRARGRRRSRARSGKCFDQARAPPAAARLSSRRRAAAGRRGRHGRGAAGSAPAWRHPAAGAAARRRPPVSGGMLLPQREMAKGQRGEEAAARRQVQRVGRRALDAGQAAVPAGAVDARHGVDQRPGVGVARIGEDVPRSAPSSTTSPAYITATRRQTRRYAEVVADQHDGGAEIRVQLAQQVEDLRLDRHVQRGGRLVGDQQRRVVGSCRSPA